MKFPHDVNANFKFVGSGTWHNDADNVSVSVNEDYRRTFAAYLDNRPNYRFVVKNKNGNAIRFRSAEAAAKHVLKLRKQILLDTVRGEKEFAKLDRVIEREID